MRKRYSFIILLLLGLFALSILTPTFAQEAKPTTSPKFTVKVSDHTLGLGEVTETWLYLKNPSMLMERDGTTIYHTVVINHLIIDQKYPTGEESYFLDPYNPDHWEHERWKTEVLPGEETLVFFLGWRFSDPASVELWEFKYTLNVEYEGTTIDLVRTFKIIVNE